jgi:hypothetical protein
MDPNLDQAIETAVERTREAEERLIEKPIESPDIVIEAHTVERRAEDLTELASDAARDAEPA